MTFKALYAAALFLAAGAAPVAVATPAEAQRTVVVERTTVRTSDRRPGYRRPAYRGNHRSRYVTRRVCTNRYYGGRRHRVCRTVRRYR